jgi:hypothetical protein
LDDLALHSDSVGSDAGARLIQTHGGHRIELWGAMPIGWLGNFTHALSGLGLNIARGAAQRDDQRRWTAQFEVRGPISTFNQLDFLALACQSRGGRSGFELALLGFQLTRSRERSGTLCLRIRARDRVGLLAALLEYLAGFVLFPEEISIDTFQDEARDTFLLSSVAGQSPPLEIEGSLRSSLEEATAGEVPLSGP